MFLNMKNVPFWTILGILNFGFYDHLTSNISHENVFQSSCPVLFSLLFVTFLNWKNWTEVHKVQDHNNFLRYVQWCVQRGFHTWAPVWVPKKRNQMLCFFKLTLRKAYFQVRKHLNYFKPFWTMKKVYLPEIESNRWPSAFNMEPLVV